MLSEHGVVLFSPSTHQSCPASLCTASAQRSSSRRASIELRDPSRPRKPRMNVQRKVRPS